MDNGQPTVAPRLSPKQAQVVQAKVYAELNDISQAVIARDVYPNQTPNAASVSMSRELKKANVQEALQFALAEHDLTLDRIMGVVDDAMGATKTVIIRDKGAIQEESDNSAFADEVPDHSIRLKAASMAANFMGLNKPTDTGNTTNFIQVVNNQKDKYDL